MWKGRIKTSVIDETITVLDYFPTFLDLAGVDDYLETLDGTSILPLAEDPTESKDLSHANSEKAREMLREMEAWREDNHVPLPPSSPVANRFPGR